MIPRIGDVPLRGQPYRLRPGAYAVLERDGRILLTFQSAPIPEYQLPGGGIDPGESPLPALHREVYEETGWHIARPRRMGVFRRFVYMPDYDIFAEKICHVYRARPVLRHGPPLEPGHSAAWLPLDRAIAAVGNDGDREFLIRLGLNAG
ncbi:NUDIX domain-containing protein [Mesobaculum littorinae]|uniref:NUDIX domain-containing protein n=1 Tax=Mesobaculum littorinae TaxID=2486419 RepID=A0A438AHD5_9RHOB|nr:NUDIX hydrolase [Mesobaculum littorinae]RVV98035.1 NUDIX domain-containing protein [Mesobaculum littorinae]